MGLGYAVLVIIILKPFLHMKMKLYLSFVFFICQSSPQSILRELCVLQLYISWAIK